MYKVLKKFGEFKKGSTFDSTKEEITEDELAEAVEGGFIELITDTDEDTGKKSEKSAVSKVIFVVRNADTADKTAIREFTFAEHGEDFLAVADEFAETNKNIVLKRTDE